MKTCERCGAETSENHHRRCNLCSRGDRREHNLGELLTLEAITRLMAAIAAQAHCRGEDVRWMADL